MDPVLLLKGALPSVVAALLLVSLLGGRGLPLAAGLGIYLAFGLLKDWPPAPHVLWHDPNGAAWLIWGMIALATVATLDHLRLLHGRAAPTTSGIAGVAVLYLMLAKIAQRWSLGDAALHLGVAAVVVALTISAFRGVLARAPRSAAPAVLMSVLLSLDAGLVTLGKSALLGQLCGAVAAALGAAVATTIWRRGFSLATPDGVWIGGAHALFVLAGVHLGYLEWLPAGFALAAPLPLWLLRGTSNNRPVAWFMIAGAMPLAMMGIAMWLAAPAPSPYDY